MIAKSVTTSFVTSSPLLFLTVIVTLAAVYTLSSVIVLSPAFNAWYAIPPLVITGLIVIVLFKSVAALTTASLDVSERSKSNPNTPFLAGSLTSTVKILEPNFSNLISYT